MNYGNMIKITVIFAAFIAMTINIFFVPVFPILIQMIGGVRRCADVEKNIGVSRNGIQVVMLSESCDEAVGYKDASIAIKMPDGNIATIMDYEDGDSSGLYNKDTEPSALWESDNSVLITIKSVYFINKKINNINGISIRYNIGKILLDNNFN